MTSLSDHGQFQSAIIAICNNNTRNYLILKTSAQKRDQEKIVLSFRALFTNRKYLWKIIMSRKAHHNSYEKSSTSIFFLKR